MKNKITAVLIACTLLMANNGHAASTGLLMNDDSVLLHHIASPNVMLLHTTYQEYSLMYSNEPDPRNLMISGSFETENYAWKFKEDQSITPRVTGIAMDFWDRNVLAVAGGAIYRYKPKDQKYHFVAEGYGSPRLTTFIRGNFIWAARFQANYHIDKQIEVNLGYRSINVELERRFYDGFERGLYFGISYYHK